MLLIYIFILIISFPCLSSGKVLAKHSNVYTDEIGRTFTLPEAAGFGGKEGVERVKKMLATGNYDDHLNGALQSAARWSTLEMVKVLVEAGADVNPKHGGRTPLHNVSDRNVDKNRSSGVQIAKYLVSKGAEIDAMAGEGVTPLYVACESNPDVTIWLLDHGADPNVEVEATERTPLMLAASKVQEKTMVKLIEKGADINVRGYENNTPLHYASYGIVEAAKALIEAGADVNAITDTGDTPLHISARFMPFGVSYQADIAKLLLKAGADPYIKNKRGKTVFDVFEKWLKKWQGDTFNIWGGQGLTDEQFECLKKWRTEMPKLLEKARRKHEKTLKKETRRNTKKRTVQNSNEMPATNASGIDKSKIDKNENDNGAEQTDILSVIIAVVFMILTIGGTALLLKNRRK